MRIAGTFVAALAAAALAGAPAAAAAYPGANGPIAFERAVAGAHGTTAQIFRAGPGGLGEALLAASRGDLPTAPSFSADGTRLAFERQSRIGYGSVSIARADGSGERTVPGDAHNPSLSPDGRRIAVNAGGSIWIERIDGSHRTRVTAGVDPEFSPDGRRIAFVSDGDVYVVPVTGGSARRLTTDGDNAGPTWSPSGRAIAFWHMATTDTVETVSAAGTGRRSLHAGMQPSWSPDGTRLAFASTGGVWTMTATGASARLVVKNAFLPAWQPLQRRR